MQLPEGTTWQLETNGETGTLLLGGFDDGFDLSNAFAIIPRTRLTALIAGKSKLELQLGCTCRVQAFLEQNRFLVLDISDTNEPEAPEIAPRNAVALPQTSFSVDDLLWSQNIRAEPGSTMVSHEQHRMLKPDAEDQNNTPDHSILLENSRSQLAHAFSRAAAIGLLETARPLTATSSGKSQDKSETILEAEIFNSSSQSAAEDAEISQNIRVSNSKDKPKQAARDSTRSDDVTCPDTSKIDIENWSSGEELSVQLAASNEALFDDLGRIVQSEILKRAKLYLHFGFGAEAYRTLLLAPELGSEHPELIDLSQVLEYGYMPNPRTLHRFSACNSDYALWSILAAETPASSQSANSKAALRGLQKLPAHLKYFLAQDLSDRLLKMGQLEDAAVAIRSFERLPENNDETPKLVHAKAKALNEEPEVAELILSDIVFQDTPEAPSALIALIDRHVSAGTELTADIALLAEAYSFELKNNSEGTAMTRASVLAATKTGQYEKALATIASNLARFDAEVQSELFSFVFSEMTSKASDIEFVERFLSWSSEREIDLSPTVLLGLVDRFVSLGFVEIGESLMQQLPADAYTNDAQLIMAEVQIQKREFADSLALLEQATGPQVAGMQARALRGLGENKAAAESFNTASQREDAVIASWLADEWPSVIEYDDTDFGAVQQIRSEDFGYIPLDDEMMSASLDAINASGEVRRNLSELLKSTLISE